MSMMNLQKNKTTIKTKAPKRKKALQTTQGKVESKILIAT